MADYGSFSWDRDPERRNRFWTGVWGASETYNTNGSIDWLDMDLGSGKSTACDATSQDNDFPKFATLFKINYVFLSPVKHHDLTWNNQRQEENNSFYYFLSCYQEGKSFSKAFPPKTTFKPHQPQVGHMANWVCVFLWTGWLWPITIQPWSWGRDLLSWVYCCQG